MNLLMGLLIVFFVLILSILIYYSYFYTRDKIIWHAVERCVAMELEYNEILKYLHCEYRLSYALATTCVERFNRGDKAWFKEQFNDKN